MECLHELFARQAKDTPHNIAAVDEHQQITFRELERQSEILAAALQHYGVEPDDTVGLYMEKSVDYIVACLAVLKAGGAFLPLFLDYPDMLLSKILEQTQSKVVISTEKLAPSLPAPENLPVILMDRKRTWPEKPYKSPDLTPENLMFVVYTSGTTGEPKGISLPHRAAVHSYRERYKISSYQPGGRVACNVFFVWEIFRPLLLGATVYVIPDEVIYDPKLLTNFLENHSVSEVLFTPSLMETMLNHLSKNCWRTRLACLEVIWLNGEVVTEKLREKALAALSQQVGLYNTYSISECHDVASLDLRRAEVSPTGFCRVGYPIEGISVLLMDSKGNPVATGEAGELYVGGPGLARGYLGKPHLTAERFVTFRGERLYRTGDLAFQYPDGLLEIRGRCDAMVKIRGYSVHLGAVGSALEKLPSVQSAAVVTIGEEGKDKRLVAYVVGTAGHEWVVDERTGSCPALREALRTYLAEFMLPNLFVLLDDLPLSPTTGKLDASRLPPPPNRVTYGLEELTLEPTADQTVKQQFMATLWERLMGLDPGVVSCDSNFFDLGGHSLMAVRLVQQIERKMGCSVSTKQLYDHPTVKQLTHLIHTGENSSEQTGPPPSDWQLDSAVRPSQDTLPTTLSQAKGVFITGATGFLGAFLAHGVLQQTGSTVYCLVRPGDKPIQERLEQNLRAYGLEPTPRLRAVRGDLSLPNLGLSSDDYKLLEEGVDVVFHCGAAVNYVHTYPVLKPHTVDGTESILKLCCSAHPKTLHYVSTNGIFPGGDTYLETDDIDTYLAGLSNGYGTSKWVAEKLVRQAADRGLPAYIYRPGNIGHHSVTGRANPNDFQTLMLRGCVATGKVPHREGWFFEMTPVDFLVRAILAFADDPELCGETFHIVQSPTLAASGIFATFETESLPLTKWTERLREAATQTDDGKLEVLADSLADVEGYLTDTSCYDNARFRFALDKHQLGRPCADTAYYRLLIKEMTSQMTAGAVGQ